MTIVTTTRNEREGVYDASEELAWAGAWDATRRATQRANASIRPEWVTVTPTQAATWLTRNHPRNRPLDRVHVKRLAGAILAGKWKQTAETVQSDEDGYLVNGQHRLTAIVQANRPASLLVAMGVDREAIEAMDQGKVRSTADTLGTRGKTNTPTLAAATVILLQWERNQPLGAPSSFRRDELVECSDRHPGLDDCVIMGRRAQKMLGLPGSVATALYYIFWEKNEVAATAFFERLITGANLSVDDPISRLRNRLIEAKGSRHLTIPRIEQAALTIKAWNLYRQGRLSKSLRWGNGGNGEEFPTVI
jgi:hypothetical protein